MNLVTRVFNAVRSIFSTPRGILGCDVSFNQKTVDWAGAKADGIVFAGIRWGQRDGKGGYTDSRGRENWEGAKAQEIDRFAYWVWDEREGHNADDHFAGVVRASVIYDGELPFCADLELEPLDWDEFHRFLILIEQWSGRRPTIYSGAWFYNRVAPLPKWLEDYIQWLTGYNNVGPSVWGPISELDIEIVCWQQTSSWAVSWVETGTIDRNYWIKDYQKYLKDGGTAMLKVVKSDELRDWIDENEYEESAQPPPPPPPPPPADRFSLIWPTPEPKVITQEWGKNPQWYKSWGLPGHEGIDFRALNDTPIYAAAAGEVYRVETDPGSGPYGIHVRIKHDHPDVIFKSVYAHFRRAEVSVGDRVIAGQLIGLADNTGNSSGAHLHLTIKRVGQGSPWMNTSDIVNPTPYLPDLFPGKGWRIDVGGNFRTSPEVADNLIRCVPAGSVVEAVDWDKEAGGDWWQIVYEGIKGWFWTPYKLSMIR